MKKIIFRKLRIVMTYCFLIIMSKTSIAQADSFNESRGVILKINPLQLIMGEARLHIEKSINARNSIEITLSYLYRSEYYWLAGYYPTLNTYRSTIYGTGYKLGAGYRYYMKNSTERDQTYINPLLFYKYVDYHGWSPDFAFYSELNIKITDMRYNITALQVNFGKVKTIKRIIFDAHIGAGLRHKYGIVEVESTRPEVIIESPHKLESGIYPSFHFGLNIGYKIKKTSK